MKSVQDALASVGVPVAAGVWRPTANQPNPPPQYLIYSTSTTENTHQDDGVDTYRTFVYLSLWSDCDVTETARNVRRAMRAAGYGMIEESDKGYNQPAYDDLSRRFTMQWTWVKDEDASAWE
jgi:hypothetical protein